MRNVIGGVVSAFGSALGQGIAQGLALALIFVILIIIVIVLMAIIISVFAIIYISKGNRKRAKVLLFLLALLVISSFVLKQEWLFALLVLYCTGVIITALILLIKRAILRMKGRKKERIF